MNRLQRLNRFVNQMKRAYDTFYRSACRRNAGTNFKIIHKQILVGGTEENWRVFDHLPDFPTVSERKCVRGNGCAGGSWKPFHWYLSESPVGRLAQIDPQVAEVRRWWTTGILRPHTRLEYGALLLTF